MNQPHPQPPRPFSKEQIKILARHSAERAELEAVQHNERCALMERQASELKASMGRHENVMSLFSESPENEAS